MDEVAHTVVQAYVKKRYEEFQEAGIRIVIISADAAQNLEEFRIKKAMPFLMLSDPECKVIRKYGVYNPSERNGIAVPSVFILDKSGVVRYSKTQNKIFRTRSKSLLKIARKN